MSRTTTPERVWGWVLFAAAVAILAINVTGLVADQRDREFIEAIGRRKFDSRGILHITPADVMREARRTDQGEEQVKDVFAMISSSMVHRWDESEKYPVNLTDNYILHLLSYIDEILPESLTRSFDFDRYEFMNHRRALTRGFGFCSQQSVAVAGFLSELGYDTSIAGLDGHVVALVNLGDGKEWILDPDFGVILRFSLTHAEQNPSDVIDMYSSLGVQKDGAADMARIYGIEGNVVMPGAGNGYKPSVFMIEEVAYYLKWIIPLMLLVLSLFFLRAK
jgi:hypothetical protein